jgi:hypothetical protein
MTPGRSERCSLVMMLNAWLRTVLELTPKRLATQMLSRPRPTTPATHDLGAGQPRTASALWQHHLDRSLTRCNGLGPHEVREREVAESSRNCRPEDRQLSPQPPRSARPRRRPPQLVAAPLPTRSFTRNQTHTGTTAALHRPSASPGSVENCGDVGISPSELNPGRRGSGQVRCRGGEVAVR